MLVLSSLSLKSVSGLFSLVLDSVDVGNSSIALSNRKPDVS